MTPSDSSPELTAGQQALDRGAWEEARGHFQRALDAGESPEAYEGVAAASWWLEQYAAAIEAREHAYRLYHERGERQAAARVAVWLALDSLDYRNELAVASGWLGRAARLVEGLGPTAGPGYVGLNRGHPAPMAGNHAPKARGGPTEGRPNAAAAKADAGGARAPTL